MTSSEDAIAASVCRSLLQTTENTIPFIARRHVPFTLTNNQSRRAVFTTDRRRGKSLHLKIKESTCFIGLSATAGERLLTQTHIQAHKHSHLLNPEIVVFFHLAVND